MGRDHLRLAAWVLAILTICAISGNHTAYAMDGPRVKAEGWFSKNDPTNPPNFSTKINFGLTARCDKSGWSTANNTTTCNGSPDGHFEYQNHFSGLKAHGRITTLRFEPVMASDNCVGDPAGDPTLMGKPSAAISGTCDDGSCSFSMKVVDADDDASGSPDWVCNVNVTDNKHAPDTSTPTGTMHPAPLNKGDVELTNGRP